MRGFFDRYLPGSERRTALWLVLGGAAVVWVTHRIGFEVATQMSHYLDQTSVTWATIAWTRAAAEFAFALLLVMPLIRFARAPRALALYLLGGALLGVVTEGLQTLADMALTTQLQGSLGPMVSGGNPVVDGVGTMLSVLAVGLGAVAGAWVASMVTLDRIRDTGFSGDDANASSGLRRKPALPGWGFMGWDGKPLTGDALVAVALVTVWVIPEIASIALYLVWMLPSVGDVLGRVYPLDWLLTQAVAWYVSARVVSARMGVVSTWFGSGAAIAKAIEYFVVGIGAGFALSAATSSLGVAVVFPAAALLGTAHALRGKPATLSASEQQDPGAGAPADTAGGTDG